ncbi:MAG: CotH kinase family protein [Bacteroidales bacterium]|nr:CotH kinase family protein [Bacteroidales bacterium]
MRKILSIACILFPLAGLLKAQTFTSSNLPIVMITTDGGVSIPDNNRVLATMKIIYRGPGQRTFLTDQSNPSYLDYNGRINIEIRGSSSQYTAKKQYGLTTLKPDNYTENNASLLGMPSEHDWILNGMAWDSAFIRDYLCFNLSRQFGEYAARTVYCEVILNGSYKGLYLFDEKVKADNNRVDISKIEPSDVAEPELSGGYITKADKTTGGDPIAFSMTSWYGGAVNYIHHWPKPEDAIQAQTSYIRNYFNKVAAAAQGGSTNLSTGYPVLIDIPSFIHYIIIAEISSNADSYGLSTFFHKDRKGKLRAGPIWDSDLTFGNDLYLWGYDRSKTNVWQLHDGGNDGSKFWWDLFQNAVFRCYLSRRWNELAQPGQPLDPAVLEAFIDQTASLISEAAGRDYAKWNIGGSFTQRIAFLKSWLTARISWINANIGSYASCSGVPVPKLVISKINFNPASSIWFPDGEELEFIEITNNSSTEVNLSGIYFAGTGLVYQFPYNSVLAPDTAIFLAANASVFHSKYAFGPFGEYSRHISNGGQKIVLADAFGNVIDMVDFSDTIPWPEADGNGKYLKLKDPALDNNNPSSWIATSDILLATEKVYEDFELTLRPNPVREILTIESGMIIESVQLFSVTGQLKADITVNSNSLSLSMTGVPPGVYILKAVVGGSRVTRSIIRY